jgi:hypothetical protein
LGKPKTFRRHSPAANRRPYFLYTNTSG